MVAETAVAEATGATSDAKGREPEVIGMDGNNQDSGGILGALMGTLVIFCVLWSFFGCSTDGKKHTPLFTRCRATQR